MKKLSYALVGIILLTFIVSVTTTTHLLAQEKEKEVEDVMDMALEDLLNVEITTASKKAEKISDIPASVVLITRDDIERYGYMSLEEILENIPGLYKINDMSYYGTSFGVRGFFSLAQRNIIFMVNGVHQFDGYWKTSNLENFSIPVEAIDRIEVVRGPMSVIYGSGAFFGAINIITNYTTEDKGVNVISASGGSMGTMKTAARFSGRTGDLSFAFSAGYYNTNGPDEPLSKMATYEPDWAGIDSTNNTTKGRLEDDNKYFNLSVDYKGFYGKMSYSESIKENYIVLPTVSDGTETTTNFTTASFGYRKDFSDKVTIDASITYHKHHWWIDWSILHPDFYDYEFGKSEEFEADVTTIFKPSDKISITSGLHYSTIFHINWFDLIPSLPFNVNYILPDSIDTRSLFVQADFSPSKKLRLVAGVRFEQMLKYTLKSLDFSSMGVFPDFTIEGVYDNEKVRFIPRFALIYSLNDKNFIKFLYGKAIRHPEFQPNLENLIYSVSSLNPEDINTFELNYMTSPNSNLTINFSLFYNQLKNLIARKFEFDSTGTLITYYGNGGELETIGAEVSLLTKPFKNFLLELSGTYQNTKDKREDFKDIDVAYSPNLLIHLKASYRFGQNVTLALMGRYVDEMEPSWDTESGERIGKTVDSHFTLDANLRLNNLFKKGFYINARVTNLFDTDYLYPANENNNLWADIGVIGRGLGRAFIITLGKKW